MILLSRDRLLAIGLLVILMVVTFITGFRSPGEEQAPAYASFSSTPEGAHALLLWLRELGYDVSDAPMDAFELTPDMMMVLMLEPTQPVSDLEWKVIDAWVEGGGTLVLAGNGFYARNAMQHYEFVPRFLQERAQPLTLQTPLMDLPPVASTADVRAVTFLSSERDDYVVHLAADERPVLVSFEQGSGRVIISSAPFPFSNLGLKQIGNAPLVLNMVSASRRAGSILFDEWHHGVQGAAGEGEITGLQQWLFRTATGQSLLFTAVVIFAALALQGRRFGRSVPLPRDLTRRAPLEYITAIANLHRRAGHRTAVMAQYHDNLKRELGHRYRLSPSLDDEEFVMRLASFRPDIDAGALRTLLARLQQRAPSENELIAAAAQAADWLDNYSQGIAL